MYRVMIIDDEKSLRNLLKASVDWNSLELEVVGEAASGIEAINTIDQYNPHLCFVDIRMPFMDGIEFSKIALERYPDLKVVILTAYDEFQYARSCIGMGVQDYLLKPIVREDIINACKKAVAELKVSHPDPDENRTEAPTKELSEKEADMVKVQDYIHENFSQTSLNLASTAQQFGYNASYLSRRFKEILGKNLSDYITECRMECAMQCIEDGKLMYQAAKIVGIPDPNYFGKCFKKYTGQTYSDLLKAKKGGTNE